MALAIVRGHLVPIHTGINESIALEIQQEIVIKTVVYEAFRYALGN
jgi:hypothetical protein